MTSEQNSNKTGLERAEEEFPNPKLPTFSKNRKWGPIKKGAAITGLAVLATLAYCGITSKDADKVAPNHSTNLKVEQEKTGDDTQKSVNAESLDSKMGSAAVTPIKPKTPESPKPVEVVNDAADTIDEPDNSGISSTVLSANASSTIANTAQQANVSQPAYAATEAEQPEAVDRPYGSLRVAESKILDKYGFPKRNLDIRCDYKGFKKGTVATTEKEVLKLIEDARTNGLKVIEIYKSTTPKTENPDIVIITDKDLKYKVKEKSKGRFIVTLPDLHKVEDENNLETLIVLNKGDTAIDHSINTWPNLPDHETYEGSDATRGSTDSGGSAGGGETGGGGVGN
ncbi:hypothetical protein GOV04_03680 [Candidatus Woesearchaeota archaeon]|nr:hypothetical protein [Candidatus Woesearchaeota archaeon]